MAIVLILKLEWLPFLFTKKLKGMILNVFYRHAELRKFVREMRQKPNFDKRNDDCYENNDAHFPDNKNLNTDRNKKEVG